MEHMQWYVSDQCVAGFANMPNTIDKRAVTNANFVSLKDRVFMISANWIFEEMAYCGRA